MAIPSLRVREGDTQHVYRGVSASTWLTSIGVCQSVPRAPALAAPCVKAVQQRAWSSAGILGRRHYEQHGLRAGESVIGKSIAVTLNAEEEEKVEVDHDSEEKDFRRNIPLLITPMWGAKNTQALRPHTSVGEHSTANNRAAYNRIAHNRNEYQQADFTECSALTVHPLLEKTGSKMGSRCRSAVVHRKTITFRAVNCALDQKLSNTMRFDETRAMLSPTSRGGEMAGRRGGRLRSTCPSLRPLMYDEELAGNVCTAAGCFNACLVSDDYFEKQEQPQNPVTKRAAVPKVHKRPARQIQRDFPDLQYLMLAKVNQGP